MNHYETAFLIAPNLPDEEIETLIKNMADAVTQMKGRMDRIDNLGKKRTAYPVHKFGEAHYVFFHYEGGPEIPAELERRFKQTEPVIRYLTLKKDTRENIKDKKKKVRTRRREPAPERSRDRRPPEEEASAPAEEAAREEE